MATGAHGNPGAGAAGPVVQGVITAKLAWDSIIGIKMVNNYLKIPYFSNIIKNSFLNGQCQDTNNTATMWTNGTDVEIIGGGNVRFWFFAIGWTVVQNIVTETNESVS